jgi:hypothetical protein
MIKTLTTLSLLFISLCGYAQSLPEAIRDSLLAVTKEIIRTDQLYRKGATWDSILAYYKATREPVYINLFDRWQQQDKYNFATLEGIIKTYGYPEQKLLGSNAPPLLVVLIHWSKGYPEWFNSPELVPYFKRELENGNMPLSRVDMAHMFYMRMGDIPDVKLNGLINNARFAYGLCPYDDTHFFTKVRIDTVKE